MEILDPDFCHYTFLTYRSQLNIKTIWEKNDSIFFTPERSDKI